MSFRFRLGAALAAALFAPSLAFAQVCVDGICFEDRGASGQIAPGFVLGGVAVLDYDGDGFQDLFFGQAAGTPNLLLRNVPDVAHPGRRTFLNATAASGLGDADGAARRLRGVLAGDVDGDGDPDIFATGRLASDGTSGLLYRNDAGVFTNVSVASGVRTTGDEAESASFVDFDLDGDLDLLIAGGGASLRPLRLLRNRGNGVFDDATALVPVLTGVTVVYSHLWSDYDDDGDPDCFLLTAGPGPTLLRNDPAPGGGRIFTNAASQSGFVTLGPVPMGLAAGDMDEDGDRDLAISNGLWGTYYRNDGAGQLREITPFRTIWGWGAIWIDVDDDGDLDHYQAGSLGQGAAAGGPANFDRLMRNLGGGAFDDVSPALNGTRSASQYAVRLDFDNDGRQDIVTINNGVPGQFVSFYQNVSTTSGHRLVLRLRGDGAAVNRDAVGAVVRVHAGGRTLVREIQNGSSTTSTEDLRVHVGLGARPFVDSIDVVWPRAGTLAQRAEIFPGPIAADQILTLAVGGSLHACYNGIDDDNDGDVDFPADLGCAAGTSEREDPACDNALDDDGDGAVDYPDDRGCVQPSGASELDPTGCGLGVELAPLLWIFVALRSRRLVEAR